MKKINLLLFFLSIAVVSLQMSCTNSGASINAGGVVIQGKITNAGDLSFYFDRVNFDNSNLMYPNTEIGSDGKFKMVIEDKLEAGIYRMRIGAKKSYLILDGTEKMINVEGDLSTFDKSDYTLGGAKASEAFTKNMKGFLAETNSREAMETYILSESNDLAAAFATLNVFGNDVNKIDLLKQIRDKLLKESPDSKYTVDFDAIVQAQEARIKMMKANELIQVGKPAPDIRLEDPNGKEIALSDLKGKIVLLDFWASWCGPCRKANPHVVETYKKYKNQGFTVYSVSLDGINPRLLNRYKTPEEINQQLEGAKKRWADAIEK
ncbi:MAG: hypothetical protein ACI81W_003486, partial [Saprospiraceae bacterium]